MDQHFSTVGELLDGESVRRFSFPAAACVDIRGRTVIRH
jgi:hypothetical protein